MKKLLNKLKENARKLVVQLVLFVYSLKHAVSNARGEAYLDLVVRLLISIVLGALLLAGLYKLFDVVVLPRLTTEVNNMFNYSP